MDKNKPFCYNTHKAFILLKHLVSNSAYTSETCLWHTWKFQCFYHNQYKQGDLVEVRKNNLKLHNIDNRDLFNLLDIFLNNKGKLSDNRKKALHYAKKNQVDKNVLMTVASTANCQLDYEELNLEGGRRNMYTIFAETMKEGGALQIIEMGQEFGLSEPKILEHLQKNLKVSEEQAQEYWEDYKKGVLGVI